MQKSHIFLLHCIEREKYFKEKLANCKGNARATYNVVNQLLDKFLGNHPPITSTAQACQFADYFNAKIEQYIVTCLTIIAIHLMLI